MLFLACFFPLPWFGPAFFPRPFFRVEPSSPCFRADFFFPFPCSGAERFPDGGGQLRALGGRVTAGPVPLLKKSWTRWAASPGLTPLGVSGAG